MSMTSSVHGEQRRRILGEMLERDGSVTLVAAAGELGVSEMTIRRDLADLEVAGVARRVRGGATRVVGPRSFRDRSSERRAAKARIAQKAAALVPDSGAIAIDASTTAGALGSVLTKHPDLVVVTNSWDNFGTVRRAGVKRAILTGGEADELTDSLVGPIACRAAASHGYRAVFAGANGLEAEFGASDVSLEEAQVKMEFARAADDVVLLADSSKVGGRDLARSFAWDEVSVLVTELDPSDERLADLRSRVELR